MIFTIRQSVPFFHYIQFSLFSLDLFFRKIFLSFVLSLIAFNIVLFMKDDCFPLRYFLFMSTCGSKILLQIPTNLPDSISLVTRFFCNHLLHLPLLKFLYFLNFITFGLILRKDVFIYYHNHPTKIRYFCLHSTRNLK